MRGGISEELEADPAVPAGAGRLCLRLGAFLLCISQTCPASREGLMAEQGKGSLRWADRETLCSWMGLSRKGPDCPRGKRVSDHLVPTDSQELAERHPKIERFQ